MQLHSGLVGASPYRGRAFVVVVTLGASMQELEDLAESISVVFGCDYNEALMQLNRLVGSVSDIGDKLNNLVRSVSDVSDKPNTESAEELESILKGEIMDTGKHFSYLERDKARTALADGIVESKIVGAYAQRTGRRKRSAAKKLLGIGAAMKRAASLKVVR